MSDMVVKLLKMQIEFMEFEREALRASAEKYINELDKRQQLEDENEKLLKKIKRIEDSENAIMKAVKRERMQLEHENAELRECLEDLMAVAESQGWGNAEIHNARLLLTSRTACISDKQA